MIENLWTIVQPLGAEDMNGKDISGKPIVPSDHNLHADEGMLVYRSEWAAIAAASYQNELYSLECVPCRLSELEAKWLEPLD